MNDKRNLENAHMFLFPLVLMDATMKYTTNTVKPDSSKLKAPVNQFIHANKLATAADRMVVTPNVDTIYTQVWLDLSDGPIVLTVPDVDRFFNVQVLDIWTDTPYVIKKGGSYVFTRDEKLEVPANTQKIYIDTDVAWLITRILINDQKDMANVKKIQDQMQIMPLSNYVSDEPYSPKDGKYNPDYEYVPVEYVLNMDPETYFNKANELLVKNPIRKEDIEFCKEFEKYGIGAGKNFDGTKISGDLKKLWEDIIAGFRERIIKGSTEFISKMSVWLYYGKPVAEFGTEYEYRAMIALFGLGANPVSVAIYPKAEIDFEGNELSGRNTYVLHFNSLPPVMKEGFWSVTAYGEDDFLIENSINRYAVNDRSNFKLNQDGSLDIILSATDPKGEQYWLPTGEKGFHLFMRMYLPDEKALKSWEPPTVKKI